MRSVERATRLFAFLLLPTLATCATSGQRTPEPLSIEFGQARYLSDAYLSETPGARCGHPRSAPGGYEARAPLPDGTWFRVFAVGAQEDGFDMVILERGVDEDAVQLSMQLDAREGIVRLAAADRTEAWGIHHPWADWMRALGERLAGLECARATV